MQRVEDDVLRVVRCAWLGPAIRGRAAITGGARLLGVAGPLSLAFGVLVLLNPPADVRGIAWVAGSFAPLYGGLQLLLGLWIRSLSRAPSRA